MYEFICRHFLTSQSPEKFAGKKWRNSKDIKAKNTLRLPQTSNCSIKFPRNSQFVVRRSDFSGFRLKKIGANENQPVNKIQIVNTMPFFSSKCNFLREWAKWHTHSTVCREHIGIPLYWEIVHFYNQQQKAS